MLDFFKSKLPYEEFGYMYADSIVSSIEQLAGSSIDWAGRPADPESVGRNLSVLCLAIFQVSLIELIPDEDACGRAVAGLMNRFTENYVNFAFDPATVAVGLEYIQAAGADLLNEQKTESFPTLVPMAIERITGLGQDHEFYPLAAEITYSFIDKVFQTSRATLAESKRHAKLV